MKKLKLLMLLIVGLCIFSLSDVYALNNLNYSNQNINTKFMADSDNILAIYLPYDNTTAPKINLQKSGSTYKFVKKGKGGFLNSGDTDLYIVVSDNYRTALNNNNVAGYPTWINEYNNGGKTTYELSEIRDQYAVNSYICQAKILQISSQGGNAIEDTCESLFGPEFLQFLNNNVFTVVRIAIPLLLILLTSFDFVKVIYSDDKDGMKKASKNFVKRLVAAILIYIIPTFLIFVVKLVGAQEVGECAEYFNKVASGEIN